MTEEQGDSLSQVQLYLVSPYIAQFIRSAGMASPSSPSTCLHRKSHEWGRDGRRPLKTSSRRGVRETGESGLMTKGGEIAIDESGSISVWTLLVSIRFGYVPPIMLPRGTVD